MAGPESATSAGASTTAERPRRDDLALERSTHGRSLKDARATDARSMAPSRAPAAKDPTHLARERLQAAADEAARVRINTRQRTLDDGWLRIVITRVYRASPSSGLKPAEENAIADRAKVEFLSDVSTLIEPNALRWLQSAIVANRENLAVLETNLFTGDNLEIMHEAAKRYFDLLKHPHRDPATGVEPTQTPGAAPSLEDVERPDVVETFANPWLNFIFALPNRFSLLTQLAISPGAGTQFLRGMFADARQGLTEFQSEIMAEPSHFWRYPPIISGTVVDLGFEPRGTLIPLLLNYARVKEEFKDELYLVAGIVVAIAALTATGPAALALAALDTTITGLDATRRYQRERENDYALAAGSLSQGLIFSDRPSSYGPVLLSAAAALLSAGQLLGSVVKTVSKARGAPAVVEEAVEAERGVANRLGEGAPAEDARGLTKTDVEAAPNQAAKGSADLPPPPREAVPLPPAEVGVAQAQLQKIGRLVNDAALLSQLREVSRGLLLIGKKWVSGTLALIRDTFYFLLDGAEKVLVRIGKDLDEWAFEGGRGFIASLSSTARGGFTPGLDVLLQGMYRLVRTKFIGTMTPLESAALQELKLSSWRRVFEYARQHVDDANAFAIKGKIAEEFIEHTPEFREAWAAAKKLAAQEHFPPDSLQFVRNVTGEVVDLAGNKSVGELTDGIIVAIDTEGKRPFARIFAVFESKSPSNARELARRKGESIGQLGWDLERFRELPTKINGHTFQPEELVVSRQYTQWHAMTPPEKPLSAARAEWIQEGLPQFKPFTGPVSDKHLNEIARRVKESVEKARAESAGAP